MIKDGKISLMESSGGKFRIFPSSMLMVGIVDYGILPLNPFANKIIQCPIGLTLRPLVMVYDIC